MPKPTKDWNNPDSEKPYGFCQECGADLDLCSCMKSYDHLPDDDDDPRWEKDRPAIRPLS